MQIENLLFILLIAMAVLFRLLASKVGEAKKGSQNPDQRSTVTPQASEPTRRAPKETDAERIRRFLEALGQPAGSLPPPPVAHRTEIPLRPVAPIKPPPSMRPFSFPQGRLTPEERGKKAVSLHKIPEVPAPIFEVHEAALPSEPPPSAKSLPETYAIAAEPRTDAPRTETYVATLLRSSTGLRNAVILREILGPPRGLSAELIGTA
jgi:hypothetical protein